MEYMYLQGADDVSRAASTMRESANDMNRAADSFNNSVVHLYKGHNIRYLDQCPNCDRYLQQMDDFPFVWCDCGYSKRLDDVVSIIINTDGTDQLTFGW